MVSAFKSEIMCSVSSTVHFEVYWDLTHIGRQFDTKGNTEAGQGTLQEGRPGTI